MVNFWELRAETKDEIKSRDVYLNSIVTGLGASIYTQWTNYEGFKSFAYDLQLLQVR